MAKRKLKFDFANRFGKRSATDEKEEEDDGVDDYGHMRFGR